jgi:small subunit ribosomal protein S21
MFGSNGHITQPESIISGFTKRNKHQNIILNFNNSKTICKTNCLKSFEVHIHNYTKNIKKKDFPEKDTEESLKVSKIHLNHYAIQSKNWFDEVKAKRGAADNSASEFVRNNEYFNLYDRNEIEDNVLKNISKNRCEVKFSFNLIYMYYMLIVKLDKNTSIEKALKLYKSKVIKTRQSSELNKRKEFIKPSVKKRNVLAKAKHVQLKYYSDND